MSQAAIDSAMEGVGSRPGRLPRGLLGLVALVVTVEGYVSRHAIEYADYMSYSWQYSREGAEGPEGRAEVICLGDSLVKTGVLPRVLEQRLDRKASNLAVYGGQAPSSFFLLRRVLESGARPRAVVVDFHPTLLATAPKSSAGYWADLVDPRDGLDLAWHTLDLGLITATTLAYVLPSSQGRHEIRAGILAALRGESPRDLEERRALRRNWRLNHGAHVAPPLDNPPAAWNDVAGPVSESPACWTPRPVQVAYLRRFLDLAALHDITVFWVIPPATMAWQARRERLGLDAPFARFLQSMQARYPNVVIIDGRRARYDRSVFWDATHLSRRGAAELSAALAELMAPYLDHPRSGPRWNDLPTFQGRPEPIPLEDLDQSKIALQSSPIPR